MSQHKQAKNFKHNPPGFLQSGNSYKNYNLLSKLQNTENERNRYRSETALLRRELLEKRKSEGKNESQIKMHAIPDLEKVIKERDEYLHMARRERAELDNYRKRVQREMKNMKRESLGNFLKDFFSPLNDLDRVLAESEKQHSYDSLRDGVKILKDNLWRVLAKAGVEIIEAKGKPFDPNLHEAMTTIPSPDHEPGTVIDVFENGYKLDDFVLTPARVIVSAKP